ncbi:AAA family ATPase [Streptomyces sp. NPDC058667]|uniref:AAA family ATPase n=1 Tax=Streptomyces sp. NPDC058667 TaxID=3346588 RepID=UPI00364A911B
MAVTEPVPWFDLTTRLVGLLATSMRLVVVDEAQRLNGDCIELLRHFHDHPKTRFALLYVGGYGCWEVLSKEADAPPKSSAACPSHPWPWRRSRP